MLLERPYPWAFASSIASIERVERGDADDRSERLGPVEVVVDRDAVDDHRVVVEAGLGVADEPGPRVVRR